MPKAGRTVVQISPAEAKVVARWLRNKPIPLIEPPRLNVPTLANGVRTEIVEQLERISERRRQGQQSGSVGVEFDRDDLQRMKGMANTGMFASRMDPLAPPEVRAFFQRCASILMRRRGRKTLFGAGLGDAVQRQSRAVVEDGADPRHLKRLRKRKRSDDLVVEEFAKREAERKKADVDVLEKWGVTLPALGDLAKKFLP